MYISRPDVRLRLRRHLRFVFSILFSSTFLVFVFLELALVLSLVRCTLNVSRVTSEAPPVRVIWLIFRLVFLRHRAGRLQSCWTSVMFFLAYLSPRFSGSSRFVGLPRFSAPSRWPSVSVQ